MSNKQTNLLLQKLNVNQRNIKNDVIAGFTLFIMLVPQGMAYAMLAGLPPVMGLYASTIPLFIYAFFASSKHLSIGPVATTSLLVFTGVSVYSEPDSMHYISLVLVLTIMVGIIQLLFGLLKVGFIVKFIPHSVLNGYTSAAAIVIGLSQVQHLLGIDMSNHLQVHLLLFELIQHVNELNLYTVFIAAGSIVMLLGLKRMKGRMPAALIVVIVSIALVSFFQLDHKGVQIVGGVPNGFPSFALPNLNIDSIQMLLPMAFTIAIVSFMESLAIAKTMGRKGKYKIYANQELKALGIANIFGACFHSYPVSGSFSRTAVNKEAGGHSQFTSIVTGLFIMITILFFTSLFYYLPNAVLAAIIVVAVYKLVDINELKHLYKVNPFEGWTWITTFTITLFVGIQWGILLGAIFTLLLILMRSTKLNIIEVGYIKEKKAFRDLSRYPNAMTLEDVLLVRIDSSLHFANSSILDEKIKGLIRHKPKTKWVVIDMAGVNDIDTISVETLGEIIEYYQEEDDIRFLFANMKGAIRDKVNKAVWKRHYPEPINLSLEKVLKEKGFNYKESRKYTSDIIDYQI
ncbi:SulP family inorganic anion transporter [Desertibacillus haloalkaliphilus]|uniref:SulP family inorganic anion transporter n=1 Tax=Desertibacillus haloalkaliphilus TaxID=1328930 RepID=UPI001C261695|nr:sulfate permease [Desertibacillus haloalkaliphilus]MBU8906307.1 sulfate permease [Desertibacillus haloalkaliphilus]